MSETTIIVVTYNSAATLPACLASIDAAGGPQLVVVDSASTDSTVEVSKRYGIAPIVLPRNQGFSVAANKGAQQAHTPYLFFLNPDADLPVNTMPLIENYFREHPGVAIIGGVLVDAAGHIEPAGFGSPVTPWSVVGRHLSRSVPPVAAEPVGWVSGAALAIRRDAFIHLHGFDEQFFMYWEDVDLCRRAWQAGYEVHLLPQLRVAHERGHSLKNQSEKTKLYDAGADRYFRKHYAFLIWLLFRGLRFLYRHFWQAQAR